MRRPSTRILGILAAGATAFAVPSSVGAVPGPTASSLRAANASIEHQKRSAVLDLYSLDARIAAARHRLNALLAKASGLRMERAGLEQALRVAQVDTRRSQQHLAERLRALYDHSATSTLEVVLGATSLTDALTRLDNVNRVTSFDTKILGDLRAAQVRTLRARRTLAARTARLAEAIRKADAEARDLAGIRAERVGYLTHLTQREALNTQEIARLDTQALAAQHSAVQLTGSTPQAALATPAGLFSGHAFAAVSSGYCLTGTTATGIPVGWGVAAVDPHVIPLGTHLTIPGYGEAVAADTGSAIIGNRIDLWFPSCAQAGAWGMRSVTIALH